MKNLDFLKTRLIAHRGYHNIKKGICENSVNAFLNAIKHNYIIELDIHLLKDNNIVVFHDKNLKRVCGINKDIKDCTYDELLKYNLFNTKDKIPLLKDVLKIVNGKVPILIEIKYYSKYGVFENKLMELLKEYKGLYAIQSFYPKTILWFKKNKKDVPIGLLSSDFKNSNSLKSIIGKTLLLDIFLNTDFISYNIKAIPNLYIKSKRKKKLILGWTVKNNKELNEMKEYCDNFICENINKLRLY